MNRVFMFALLLCLCACTMGSKPERQTSVYSFSCDTGSVISVRYLGDHRARLAFDGRAFDMYRVSSASGAKYATEHGLKPDTGLVWWEKTDNAMLMEMTLDHMAEAESYPQLASCRAL